MGSITHWKRQVNQHLLDNLLVSETLATDAIEQQCHQHGHRWRQSFWSPAITLTTFLLQVLDGAKTLRSALALLLTQLAARGESELPSPDPSAYCQARQRLPARVITGLMRNVAERLRTLVDRESGWLGRRVLVIDGSSVSMPDTPELQQAFPRPPGQAPGCGFPVAQFVAVFCWTTGAIVDLAIDSIRPHELNLVRRLYNHFAPGDVVLADRAYGSYVDLARLRPRGVDCVFRLHQRRKADFRRGKRLGQDDQLVVWVKPKRWLPSCDLSPEAFAQLPGTLTVRLVRIATAPGVFAAGRSSW